MSTTGIVTTHRADAVASGDERDGVARWIVRILAWTVILGCVLVLAAAVLVPRVAGATPYTILTGSMKPDFPPGTLVVVRPVDTADIHVGSVVTYQLRSGEPEVVTHRVVDVGVNLEGETRFETRGDANSVSDPELVRPEQVRGTLWYSVPHLGRVNTILDGHERQLLVYGAAGLLALYAGAMFAGAGRDRVVRSRRDSAGSRS